MIETFFVFYLLIFTAKIAGLYDGQKPFYVCVAIGAFFYLIKMLTTKMSVLEYAVSALLLGIGAVVYMSSGEKGLLLFMAVVTGMKAVNSKKVLTGAFVAGSVTYLILILITSLGVISDGYHVVSKFLGTMFLRRYLGQPGSNVTHTVLFILMAIGIALVIDKIRDYKTLISALVIIMLLNVYLFAYTMSVTGLLSISFLAFLTLVLFSITRIDSKVFAVLSNAVMTLIIGVSIILPMVVSGKAYEIADKVFNHRVEYAKYYLENEKITLFGSRFAPAPNGNYYLDNAFMYLFLQLGLVAFVIIIFLLFFTLNHILKDNDRGALVIFASFMFIGMSDPFLFNASFKNVIFVYTGKYLYEFLNELNRKYSFKEYSLLKWNHNLKAFDAAFDKCVAFCRTIMNYFENNTLFSVIIFVVLPMLGVLVYYLWPQLYDVSLLAAGDRLAYYTESEIYLNKELNENLAVLRTGVLDGVVIAAVVSIIKIRKWVNE